MLGSHLRSPHWYILVQFNSTLPLGLYAQSHYALLVHCHYALHSSNGLILLSLLFKLVLSRSCNTSVFTWLWSLLLPFGEPLDFLSNR
jgi:hypothetical protein